MQTVVDICSDNSKGRIVSWNAKADVKYYVLVSVGGGYSNRFAFGVKAFTQNAPSNDACDRATDIQVGDGSVIIGNTVLGETWSSFFNQWWTCSDEPVTSRG